MTVPSFSNRTWMTLDKNDNIGGTITNDTWIGGGVSDNSINSISNSNDSIVDYDYFGFTLPPPDPLYEQINLVITHLYFLVSMIGLMGNGGVLTSIILDRRLHNNTNILLVNGCIADIAVSLCVALVQYYERMANSWHLGVGMCKVREFVAEFTPQTSIIIMMEIAIERYIAITRPLSASSMMSRKKLLLAAMCAWLFPGLISCRLLFTANLKPMFGRTMCYKYDSHMGVYVAESVLFYAVPLVAMSVVYSVVIRQLRNSIRQQAVMIAGSSRSFKSSAKDEQSTTIVQSDSGARLLQAPSATPRSQHNRLQVNTPNRYRKQDSNSSPKYNPSNNNSQASCTSHPSQNGGQNSQNSQSNQQSQANSAKSRMNVVSMLAVNVILFGVFTFPLHFSRIYMLVQNDITLLNSETLGFLIVANSIAFRCLDSALNPTVIIILSPRIRSAIQRIFCRRCARQNEAEQIRRGAAIQMRQQPTRIVTTTNVPNGNQNGRQSRNMSQSSIIFGHSSVAKTSV